MVLDRKRVVSGAYSATWNANDIGNVAIGGYKLRYSYLQKEINFDAVGLTPVDTLFTGLVMMLDFVCMQYSTVGILGMSWPWGDITGGLRGNVNAAGFSMWDAAKPFIMTSCSNATNPTSITFYKTILAPGFEVIQDHSGVQEKVVPIRLIVFPVAYDGSGYATPSRPVACTATQYFTEVLSAV